MSIASRHCHIGIGAGLGVITLALGIVSPEQGLRRGFGCRRQYSSARMIVMTLWVTEGSAGSVVDLEPHELSGLGHQVRFGINKPGAAWLLLLVKAERQQTDVVRRDARPWVGSGRPPPDRPIREDTPVG
jgi:hypothetical protein